MKWDICVWTVEIVMWILSLVVTAFDIIAAQAGLPKRSKALYKFSVMMMMINLFDWWALQLINPVINIYAALPIIMF